MIGFLSKLAFRNLGRHRRRTIIVGMGITLGVTVITIQSGFVAGVRHQMINRLVVAQFGHVAVVPASIAGSEGDAADIALIEDPALMTELVHGVFPDAGVVPSLSTLGMAFGEVTGTGRVVLWGVTAGDPMLTDRLTTPLDPGKLIEATAYVGAALAEQLEVRSGDVITLSVVDPGGNLDAMDFEIAEILENGAPWQDYFVYVPLGELQSLMGIDRAVDSLKVYLDRGIKSAGAATSVLNQALEKSGEGVHAEPYEKTGRLYMGIITAAKIQALVVEIILLIAVALGVGSAQILSIHERRREIGTMRALGTSRGAIRFMFLAEGVLLSLIAGGIGALIGSAITGVLGRVGIETGIEAFRWMIGGARLVPRVDVTAIAFAMLELVVVVTLSGLYPAWRAARLAPARAIQEAAG